MAAEGSVQAEETHKTFLQDPLGAVGHGIADVSHKIGEVLHLDAIPHGHGVFHEHTPEPAAAATATAEPDTIEPPAGAASAGAPAPAPKKQEPRGDAIEAAWKAATTPHGHGIFHEEQKVTPKGDSFDALGRGISGTFKKVLHHESSAPDAQAAAKPAEAKPAT